MNQSRQPKERFQLVFEAQPGETPIPVRLRHLLKRALRDWGLKCTSAVQLHADASTPAPVQPQEPTT